MTLLATKLFPTCRLGGASLLSIVLAASLAAQGGREPPVRSVGRGAPVSAPLYAVPTNPAEIAAARLEVLQGPHVGRRFKMDGAVPRLGADVPRWYGETIGFWDGDVLVTWTSNIQGWMSHGQFEFSNRMQKIEIYAPRRDANGTFLEGDPQPFVECIQTIFPIDGLATPVPPGTVIPFEVPDMYGRPWAQIWEKHWEQGMERPQQADIFDFE